MAEDNYVEPLTGEEIIVDLCELIAAKLRKDCNLRDTDAYHGGYSAKVTIHLEAYGMDAVTVEALVEAGKPQSNPDELVDTELVVPVEPALDQVRERSSQPVPTLTIDSGGKPLVRPRRYARREQVVS
jgi:hypothetical protein